MDKRDSGTNPTKDSTTIERKSDRELVVTRRFNGPADVVFKRIVSEAPLLADVRSAGRQGDWSNTIVYLIHFSEPGGDGAGQRCQDRQRETLRYEELGRFGGPGDQHGRHQNGGSGPENRIRAHVCERRRLFLPP